ncbi:ABC transporter ATP-binding protein [Staphylococcus kloosii]|jgi:osmoprotectant transport system ATP-binding protein|uniref:Glycine/betaine ABC transporter ATP-binding protein n=1 Tax=Staphylococcus kloosii TaxID=29384 RepID=A0ABQ0XM34_9STAP|nr:ABC transporter ATP-binding protein [Staphylococcus kloosii]AVQ36824.1 ABC transporter ATP-binding protein [Staphylococcus kloosii]MBF7028677.1 ABC transporter ATP-binding protein [Staphylococcus kloosii]MCD8878019.1 ABC transporter ATP-binding protein [Staphylococcus kloosii]PNZ06934.1 glycine/betaine ABC transporter ATP-binding protein [Staphylococcus kloosii]PTJ79578.1 ABC transporter ATP-binding protein [Staphylococcus kloosii]
MIKFNNVSKRYGDKLAVEDVSFNIEQGEFFVLIGPSGCGKTTTLKMINRLIALTGGYIYFNDKPISDYPVYEMRWDIGYVLQQIALFPHMTIKENIAQVPQMKKWKQKDIDSRIDELLNMVNMDPEQFKNRKPDELSGGQRQRIGVIRALAADPPVILMDEPFSALDPISREKLQDDLIELQQKIKKTIVFVTHDIEEAMKLGDRICLMNDGKVEQIDTPEGFMTNPQSDFVKQFMGSHLERDTRNIKLRDVINHDVEQVDDLKNEYPTLDGEATIKDAYAYLAQHPAVIVTNQQNNKQHILKREDMFNYLAEVKGGSN